MGIRPNGDVTPCPYLPVFDGNLRERSLTDIWNRSDLFVRIRRRSDLGDRCGECEFNPTCGGCRARAYGVTGDLMAEDPLCTYQPGRRTEQEVRLRIAPTEYGHAATESIRWEDAARERMKQIPAFVRGMVTRSVESYCAKNGITTVTPEVLEDIRSRMPTPKMFGKS
jgi:radical SAM protein with 4Fe4S-binding SPASM domain